MNHPIIIIAIITSFIAGSYFTRKRLGGDLITEQSKKKAENLKQVLGFFETKEKITNNDIEKLLGVSNATAERYLNELEKEGKLVQNGKTGQGVFYTLK